MDTKWYEQLSALEKRDLAKVIDRQASHFPFCETVGPWKMWADEDPRGGAHHVYYLEAPTVFGDAATRKLTESERLEIADYLDTPKEKEV
jgi:hypothetical protein